MKNINFDNPYLLLIALPLLLVLIIPFAIAIRKDNVSKSAITSLILHVLMIVCIALAVAGTTHTTVMTETNVYVVADVSYSTQRNLDTMDEYIRSVEDSLPNNSKMGVVCFGKDQVEHVAMGQTFTSVKNSGVDVSATDIAAALNHTVTLFNENVICRIVLITDGSDTSAKNNDGLLAAIENLYLKDIYLDVIYLDTNIAEDVDEVQISEVDFTPYTYKNHETTANVLIESNRPTTAVVSLYQEEEEEALYNKAVTLSKGYNVVNFNLTATQAGTFAYRVEVATELDATPENNAYTFTQQVEDVIEILLISQKQTDYDLVEQIYGENANIYAPLVPDANGKTKPVPFSVEELCVYDEIVVSDFDIREIQDRMAFVESLDKAVSLFGKSLITIGNTQIQNMTENDVALSNLANMLPVKYGNAARDKKMLAIVFDISHSMSYSYKYQLVQAKRAAKQLINLLNDDDMVLLLPFAGSVESDQVKFLEASDPQLMTDIDNFTVTQGTMLGSAVAEAYKRMRDKDYAEKELYIISDGLTAQEEIDNGIKYDGDGEIKYYPFCNSEQSFAKKMKVEGSVYTSSIYIYRPGFTEAGANKVNEDAIARLQGMATDGGGKYYVVDSKNVDDIMLNDVAENLTESIVERVSEVDIAVGHDKVLSGLTSLPQVSTYVNSKEKGSATTVLTTKYVKANGTTIDVPIYSYWSYGSGKVSSFTTALTGEWVSAWKNDKRAETFIKNLFSTNIPKAKNSQPYTVSFTSTSLETEIEIIPAQLNYRATTELTVIAPNGERETKTLSFDSRTYTYTFETPLNGRYQLLVRYTCDDIVYESVFYLELPYASEYDSFTIKNISNLTDVVRNRGKVYTDGNITMENDKSSVLTYEIDCTIMLLIIAIATFIVDIVVRKLTIEDFKSLFKSRRRD